MEILVWVAEVAAALAVLGAIGAALQWLGEKHWTLRILPMAFFAAIAIGIGFAKYGSKGAIRGGIERSKERAMHCIKHPMDLQCQKAAK